MAIGRESQAKAYLQGQGVDYCVGVSWGEVRDQLNRQNNIDQETRLIMKDFLSKLSEEARQVLEILLDVPQDLLQTIHGGLKYKKSEVSWYQIRYYLRFLGWKYLVIDKAFKELKKKFISFQKNNI